MEKKHELIDNAAEKRYEFDLGGDLAMIEYIKAQGFIVLTHTEVPEKYEGQGIGSELTRAVLEDLRAKKLPMIPPVPLCGTIHLPPSRMGGRGAEGSTRQITQEPAGQAVSDEFTPAAFRCGRGEFHFSEAGSCNSDGQQTQKSSVRKGTTGSSRVSPRLPGWKSRKQ